MIELPRPPFDLAHPRIKIFGLGGAGCNMIDRIALEGLPGVDLVAINTDMQALTGSIAETKVQIGQTITRGLGAGGDPEVGRTAAEEGIGEILATLADATIVFLVVGLGGGTGSGAAPVIAEITREHNAMLVVIATLPFHFEGKRRCSQAMTSLTALHRTADILLCFENDKMGEAVSPKASIQEAFAVSDTTIAQTIRAMAQMASRRGPLHAGFDEVASVVKGTDARALFGFGEASGDNRANEALEAAFKNPLLDQGRRLKEAESAFVQVAGGADMTLSEIEILMEQVHKHVSERTHLFFGATVDHTLTGKLSVTVLSAAPAEIAMTNGALNDGPGHLADAPIPRVPPPRSAIARRQTDMTEIEADSEGELDLGLDIEPEPAVPENGSHAGPARDEASDPVEEPPVPAPAAKKAAEPAPAGSLKRVASRPLFASLRREPSTAPSASAGGAPTAVVPAPKEVKAEQMQFEPVNRGRFEKSEPTIIDGQDLDVPTFLRRNVRVK